jgi:putative ABC transport system permease protein
MGAGIPLAWLQLTHEKRRLFAALIGISFAVVLMLTQLGFRDALLSSVGKMHSSFIGDLVLISPNYRNLVTTKSFTERRLYQALASTSVDSVHPLYLDSAAFKNPVNKKEITMYVIGFKPTVALLDLPGLAEQLPRLRKVGNVLFDSIRRPEFGPVSELFEQNGIVTTEIVGKRVDVVGLFQLGTSFGSDGHVVMSDETFQRLLDRQPGIINAGLIRLKPGADVESTRAEIDRLLPPDVEVITKQEFVDREVEYWSTSTPIGFVFGLGVLVGIFIGCIIVYQILYTDVTNHLPEYATLKAMGYRDGFLVKVVMKEALILSVLGFFPGVLVSHFVYLAAREATLLPMVMTAPRTLAVYGLTVMMCSISALLAVRRLKSADPAEIF